MSAHTAHARVAGALVLIGFGSIGKGTLPLIERHIEFDPKRLTVVEPREEERQRVEAAGYRFCCAKLTPDNYVDVLRPLLEEGEGQSFCVNMSVDVESLSVMRLCREIGALYIDTVVEPWEGQYFDASLSNAQRTNYALRRTVRREKEGNPGGTTAVSCCGANPGMVSWFVKQALVNLAKDMGRDGELKEPAAEDREGWARYMRDLGVKGVHIAERDTQRAVKPKPLNVFWNTWSAEGFVAEGLQPSELGYGTFEKWMPSNGHRVEGDGSLAAVWLEQPGAETRVRTWCPTAGAQYGFLVTHNESISISAYFSVYKEGGELEFRPTVHYAYHPPNDAVLSLHEMFGNGGVAQPKMHVLREEEILDGIDELGVLLYGHAKNAYWYGSRLSIEESRKLAPHQNATGLQVTSAILAGMVWALENPEAGIVESDEMDYKRCLEVQLPYLGPVEGHYTDWTPLKGRPGLFEEDMDPDDPWQLRNTLVHEKK